MEKSLGRSVASGDTTVGEADAKLGGRRGNVEQFRTALATELVAQSRTTRTIPWPTVIELNATSVVGIGELMEEVVRAQGSTDSSAGIAGSLWRVQGSEFNHTVRLLTMTAFTQESSRPRMFAEKVLRELCCPPPHILFGEEEEEEGGVSATSSERISVAQAAIKAGSSMFPVATESRAGFAVWALMSMIRSTRMSDTGIDNLVGLSDPSEPLPAPGVKAIFREICSLSTPKEVVSAIMMTVSGTAAAATTMMAESGGISWRMIAHVLRALSTSTPEEGLRIEVRFSIFSPSLHLLFPPLNLTNNNNNNRSWKTS